MTIEALPPESTRPLTARLRPAEPDLGETARRIGEVLTKHAAEVDRDARFPRESIEALRSAGLLGAFVPKRFGGRDASLAQIVDVTEQLARRCSATGMIFAMHQIQVACLVEHAADQPSFSRYLSLLTREQRLIASATSEVGTGGDLRQSIVHVEYDGEQCCLEKRAQTVSYGEHADDILLTARRSKDAPPSDQVLVLLPRGEFTLEPLSVWNTLGMRGTCSPGFVVRAGIGIDRIVGTPFADVASRTMVPVSHLLWSAVWLGIAADALRRAHSFVRAAAKRDPGTLPPGALRLAEASALLDTLRSRSSAMLEEYERERGRPDAKERLSSLGFATKINGLKVAASELVVEIVTAALRIIGMAGYREEGELSVARHLRDAHSAALMISNDRIYSVNASLLLAQKELR